MKQTVYYCHPGAWQTTWKVVHFWMLISLNKWKWLRICFKKSVWWKTHLLKYIWCRYKLELPQLPHKGNSNVYLQNMLLKKGRKLYGNLHFPSIMFIVFTSFKHPKLPISVKIPVTLPQIVYICMTAMSRNLSSWTTSLLTCYLRGCKSLD